MKIEGQGLKALELLTEEFQDEKYGRYVKKELGSLIAGATEEIGFQTESSDVILSLSLSGAVVEYDYWDEGLNDYVCGEDNLSYEVVFYEICKVIG